MGVGRYAGAYVGADVVEGIDLHLEVGVDHDPGARQIVVVLEYIRPDSQREVPL